MITLGIHDGHNCGACIFDDGKLIFSISEERITRRKNEYGYPINSIKKCLQQAKIKSSDINHVAVSTKYLPPKYFLVKRNTSFKIIDYIKEQNDYWYPKIYLKKNVKYLKVFKNKIINKSKLFYNFNNLKNEDDLVGMQNSRRNLISDHLNIKRDNIFFYDHHECHAYYGFYGKNGSKDKNPNAVVVLDGGGDGSNASIWKSENRNLKLIYKTNEGNIGRMYRYATLMLGMKPTEHEFKVMGLAGYSLKTDYYENAINIYKNTLNVNGLKFYYKHKPLDNFFYFKNKLLNERFDTISYAIQYNTERLLFQWFNNISSKLKTKNFIFSGGVAQNIKATKKILESKKIDTIYIPPGPGDESLPIGAVYNHLSKIGYKSDITTMENPYVSSSYSNKDIYFLKKQKKLSVKKVKPKDVAKILITGEPVGRFSLNKGEFGPRALGNRSILADPRKQDILNTINKKIKVRDFWMPFAPSIISEDANKFLHIIKKHKSTYMTISFDSKEYGRINIPAAVHPFDKTARPQIVYKNINKEYYILIKEFKKLSKVGALLNTSFNLHGEPIIESPRDALRTFKKSGLKYLYIGDYLIKKLS